ncbi:hypothetical protein WA026_003354 [Henosepilachna vigintioctopunctata]|uniref:ZAD domain-containing protein n=1 Tax=Henosepilachna vigintioctopunctata TaxID=420089 RepID=A0AAW1THE2_9CUCU
MENCETERICRLCLGKVQLELEENLHISAIQMLDLCLPEIDQSLCSDCAFCLDCFNCLKGIYVFKRKCLQTEEKIRLYLENCDRSNVNLKHIVECVSMIKEGGSIICRSCLSISAELITVHIDNSNFGLILKNMLMTCIPEMDLNLLDNPIICTQCTDLLKEFYSFKSKCLQTEEEIVTFKEDTKTQIVNLAGLIKTQECKENETREQIAADNKLKFELDHTSIGNIGKIDISPEMKIKTEKLDCVESNLVERNSEDSNKNFKPEGHFHFVNCGSVYKAKSLYKIDSLKKMKKAMNPP